MFAIVSAACGSLKSGWWEDVNVAAPWNVVKRKVLECMCDMNVGLQVCYKVISEDY